MLKSRFRLGRTAAWIFGQFAGLASNCRGNITVMTALAMPVLVGSFSVGVETSSWYLQERGMQNAADAAAIAAATNAGANYDVEAKGVAAQYGFQDGVNNITVTATNTAACPAGGNNCYGVTISSLLPIYLAQVVGFHGNGTLNGSPAVNVRAVAVAARSQVPRQYCLLSLNSIGVGILANGVPKADMAGCNVMSDSSATCNGHDLGADFGDAHITDNGCGVTQESDVPTLPDPYGNLAANIPANPCASYPQEPAKKKDPALPASNLWSGAKALAGNQFICGDLQLTADVTIDAPTGAVLVIENGQLDTNGHKITTTNGSGVTIVFSGTNDAGYTHAPTGGGTLDIAAPTSGVWSGVAMYQDPAITTGVDIAAAGNSPTWDITGLVYLPHSNVTFSGAVNKSSNGHSCFAMVVNDVTINGTGSILEHGDCAAAGLNMPTGSVLGRGELVT